MNPEPKFDLETLMKSYTPPDEGRRTRILELLEETEFKNTSETFAIVGIGGTFNSAYSPARETIMPVRAQAAKYTINFLQGSFMINKDPFSYIDLFAKDSRDITDDDLVFLLDLFHVLETRRACLICGTYMLPRIALLLKAYQQNIKPVTAVTGSILPMGFTASDAPLNLFSAITAVNYHTSFSDNKHNKIIAIFHGQIFEAREALSQMNLHPKDTENTLILYPQAFVPAATIDN